MNSNNSGVCYECQQSTSGRCWRHSTQRIEGMPQPFSTKLRRLGALMAPFFPAVRGPWSGGEKAARLGFLRTDCPYPEGSNESVLWLEGYDRG